jgi:carboxyl-terminal processing protease
MKKSIRLLLVPMLILMFSLPASAHDCNQVRSLIDFFLKTHYSVHELDQSLAKRTIENFVKALDPGKVYFYQKDIDPFYSKLVPAFPNQMAKADCSAIEQIYNLYSVRFAERYKDIVKLIDVKPNFKIQEFLTFDRKKLPYATDANELKERWRKRIKFQILQLMETINSEKEIRQKLHKRYELAVKQHNNLTTDDMFEMFLDSFATALDPHSDYFSPSQLEEFRISTRLSLEGIGALLRSEDGITHIQSLVPGGAAQKTGVLKPGDKIVAVAQGAGIPVDVIDMDIQEVVKLIRGTGGTEVRLTIKRDGKSFVVPIIREKVQLADRAAKSKIYEISSQADPKQKYTIGVIDLPSFYMDFEGKQANKKDYRSSSRDVMIEIEKLKKQNVSALIVDLRSNGGGSLDEAIDVAGLFTGPGPVVQVKGVNTKPQIHTYDGKAVYDGLLLVLIDRQSASASEIMAGAIQDYERGLIIGASHTFGKGTVQNVNDIDPRLGAIKVTISKFYRPDGSSTQLKGVPSDIVLPSVAELYEVGEKFYDYALAWDKIDSVPHKDYKMVSPFAEALNKASNQRTQKEDKNFLEIAKAMDEYKKKEAKEPRSLLRRLRRKTRTKKLIWTWNKTSTVMWLPT